MKAEPDTITAREFYFHFAERHGQCPPGWAREFLYVAKIERLQNGGPGKPALWRRSQALEALRKRYPKTAEERNLALTVTSNNAVAAKDRQAPYPPAPNEMLAKLNLTSWAVAAQFRMVQDLRNCPVPLAQERRTQACLFSNFLREGIAPCLAGLSYDGQDGRAMAQKLAEGLRLYAIGKMENPPPAPDWLTRAQGKITLLAASVGMNPELFDGVTPETAVAGMAAATA